MLVLRAESSVCMCVCLHVCTRVPGCGGQWSASDVPHKPVLMFYLCVFLWVTHACLCGLTVSVELASEPQRSCLFPNAGISGYATTCSMFMWVLRTGHRSLYLRGRHSTDLSPFVCCGRVDLTGGPVSPGIYQPSSSLCRDYKCWETGMPLIQLRAIGS